MYVRAASTWANDESNSSTREEGQPQRCPEEALTFNFSQMCRNVGRIRATLAKVVIRCSTSDDVTLLSQLVTLLNAPTLLVAYSHWYLGRSNNGQPMSTPDVRPAFYARPSACPSQVLSPSRSHHRQAPSSTRS